MVDPYELHNAFCEGDTAFCKIIADKINTLERNTAAALEYAYKRSAAGLDVSGKEIIRILEGRSE